ncbi:Hermansky-Pudlak syndrome 1 protein homolog [Anneissia japonica]|uniref:Hermansky-Pudlak syndrome 1 protein homolog n=1 Tax=Anneissia japonica TaxID=1529436 RepID=UPI0014255AEB|nr:Hermansky-Pudlak syndrome 1 protein homolog [Anneissia japonica]
MKCLIVLMNSGIPDIVFMSADAEFIRHVNKVAVDKGLVQKNEVSWEKLDLNIATQFFSPIVASHGLLSCELDNGYSSITCENGSIFVFREFCDHLYIAFNGDGKESEDFLSRKLLIFNKIVSLHFGPVIEELRPDNIAERTEKWKNLGSVLNTWLQLYDQEQCFLFEAIERLQVNQGVNEMCINLLETTLKKMHSMGDKYALHTMLLVNAKLLALFSSRNANELQPSDILLLTVLACDIYPSMETLDDMLSRPYKAPEDHPPELLSSESLMKSRGQRVGDEYPSKSCDGEDSNSVSSSSYHSPKSTPERCTTPVEHMATPGNKSHTNKSPARRSFNKHAPHSSNKGVDEVETDSRECVRDGTPNSLDIPVQKSGELESSECFHTPHADVERSHIQGMFEEQNRISESSSDEETIPEEPQPRVYEDVPFSFANLEPTKPRQLPRQEKLRIPVFLRGHTCQYTPHIAQFIPILQGITLIILSELKSSLASLLCRALKALESLDPGKVTRRTRVTLKQAVEELETCVKKIRETLQKSKGVLHRQFVSLSECWDNCRKFGLLEYANSGISEPMTPRLESAVSELKKILKAVFRVRYLTQRKLSGPAYDKHEEALDIIQKNIAESLNLYKQYFTVKAQRNITMTTYLERFPGLVHFIYIDRSADLITAPAVNVTKSEGSDGRDASLLIHDKVWSMTDKLHKFIKDGYISVAYREGDFFYSYFLWFEDTLGSSLECREPPSVNTNNLPPGIIATDFYKNLVQTCFPNLQPGLVQCYELICIHLGVVPIQYVLAQSQKLALWLWETGDIQKPIPLL